MNTTRIGISPYLIPIVSWCMMLCYYTNPKRVKYKELDIREKIGRNLRDADVNLQVAISNMILAIILMIVALVLQALCLR